MKDKPVPKRVFRPAAQEAEVAAQATSSPQTEHPAYLLAFQDSDFLLREDLRPIRFQLELLKPELLLDEANIASTFVFYGSARIPSPEDAEALVAAASGETQTRISQRLAAKSKYYAEARALARTASQVPLDEDGRRQFVICSGGGPSIMEAANRGADDVGATSIGLNIVLPHEQAPNHYVTPELSFNFHYFAVRKMHFLMRARAICVFPGGFGTMDEMFEALTLIQTGRMERVPFLLFGRAFWEKVINWEALADAGTISDEDLNLFRFVDSAQEAAELIENWEPAPPRDKIPGRD